MSGEALETSVTIRQRVSSNHPAPEIDRTMKPDDLEDLGLRERLPELRDKICAPGARLRVTLSERDGWRTVEIEGN